MCGIVGIVGQNEVAAQLYDGLTVLQHRGQDAAGIATAEGGRLRVHKGNGLVRDVFDAPAMAMLAGRVGIGHCRYPTAGSEGSDEAQPFYVNSPYGIALAHNGNLINTDALRREVFEQDRRNINTESDSEVLLNVFAHELDLQKALTPEAAFRAIEGVNRRAQGGYAVVSAVLGLGLVAFRDPHGIRPLVLGRRTAATGDEYIVASESVALDVLGFERVRDVAPGEGIVVTARGEMGELQVRGPTAACMYWNNREQSRTTFLGEWTRSGDKYAMDDEGHYVYCGRRDDMLKVGGIYVSPFEVEGALQSHADVLEAAVVAWPDSDDLIKPKAFVVLKEGAAVTVEDLIAHCETGLAEFKVPREIVFRESLPKTAVGKVLHRVLRESD